MNVNKGAVLEEWVLKGILCVCGWLIKESFWVAVVVVECFWNLVDRIIIFVVEKDDDGCEY